MASSYVSAPYGEMDKDNALVLKNQIEYLKVKLEADQKKLGNLLYKEYLAKEKFTKEVAILTGVAVVGGTICGFGTGDAFYGLGTGAVVVGILDGFVSLLYIDDKGSSKEIGGYRECTEYEKALLNNKSYELSQLENNSGKSFDKINESNEDEALEEDLDLIKEGIKLRYYFGYHRKRIIGMYNKGILLEVLKSLDYSDAAIAEFMIYIESIARELKYTKQKKKDKRKNKKLAFQRKVSDFLSDL